MNWSDYRTNHLETYGPTTRAKLSSDYAKYKKSAGLAFGDKSRVSLLSARNLTSKKVRSPKRTSPIRSIGKVGSQRSIGQVGSQRSIGRVSSPRSIGQVGSQRSIGRIEKVNSPRVFTNVGSQRSLGRVASPRVIDNVGSQRSIGRVEKVVPSKSGKKLLTKEDFNRLAKNKKFLIIVVYANWCGACKF
jgi:hypothetical protein